MTIKLDLRPEVERGLLAQAQLRGLSLEDYVREIVTREAQVPAAADPRAQSGAVILEALQASPYQDVDLTPPPVGLANVRDVAL